jgi:hypothetical protein
LGNLITALLVTAGLFLCLGIRAADMPEKKKAGAGASGSCGQAPGRIERMASEAEQMLTAAGMQAQLGTYKRLALVLGMAGLLIARPSATCLPRRAGCGPRRHAPAHHPHMHGRLPARPV